MIEQLRAPFAAADIDGLAALLVAVVDGGASVSFLPPLAPERARDWWRDTLAGADPRAIFLVARDGGDIVGSVQLQPAWAPNQPHRAEVCKMVVHPRARRRGIGRALLVHLEQLAQASGFTLLTLDTERGSDGETLYRALGWTFAGIIPRYALNARRELCDTVLFYKSFG